MTPTIALVLLFLLLCAIVFVYSVYRLSKSVPDSVKLIFWYDKKVEYLDKLNEYYQSVTGDQVVEKMHDIGYDDDYYVQLSSEVGSSEASRIFKEKTIQLIENDPKVTILKNRISSIEKRISQLKSKTGQL